MSHLPFWVRTAGCTAVLAASAALGMPSPAAAEAGWQQVGSSVFYEYSSGLFVSDMESPAYSGGNDFRACISTKYTGDAQYQLWELDPGDKADVQVGDTWTQTAGGCETWNVDAYVDGSNNRAELYIRTNDPAAVKVVFYD